jgi:hypothetical protein
VVIDLAALFYLRRKLMTEQSYTPFLLTVCADCGVPGQESELPDGKTYFCCHACGGSKMATVDVTDNVKLLFMENDHD